MAQGAYLHPYFPVLDELVNFTAVKLINIMSMISLLGFTLLRFLKVAKINTIEEQVVDINTGKKLSETATDV